VLDTVMAAYISHGPSGFGAFPEQGSTVANRINTGATDADMLTNAGVNSSFAYSTSNFTNVLVQKPRASTFDHTVYYRNDLKNTCCLGTSACVPVPSASIWVTDFTNKRVEAFDSSGNYLS